MKLPRGHAAPLYRVYSEREFFGLADCQPESTWRRQEALAGEHPPRTRRRSAGAAVAAVSPRLVAPVAGVALLGGAVGVTAAVVASGSHARRAAVADSDDRSSFLAFSSGVVAGPPRAPAAARRTGLRRRTPHDRRHPDGLRVRTSWLLGGARSAARQTRSSAVAGSAARLARPTALIGQANAAPVPGPPAIRAHYAAAPVSGIGSPQREHADFTFER
jgi:hypothetical protein